MNVLNSRVIMALGLGLSRALPSRPAYWLAEQIASLLSWNSGSALARVIQANQWIVRGEPSPQTLYQCPRIILHAALRCLYDYYHTLNDPQAVLKRIELDPRALEYIESSQEGKRGLLLVCPHLSAMDLGGRALVLNGMRMQVITFPQPPANYRWQNRLRASGGMEVTPSSPAALRQAFERLQSGGTVLTAVDRPLPGSNYRPLFFGRPASLPVGHISLALKLDLPVVVIGVQTRPDGHYRVWVSDPIQMRRDLDAKALILRNAEAVLAVIERAICQNPDQWLMFHPVWPESLKELSSFLTSHQHSI